MLMNQLSEIDTLLSTLKNLSNNPEINKNNNETMTEILKTINGYEQIRNSPNQI